MQNLNGVPIGYNVLALGEGGDFHHKTVFGKRNPAFWVGSVSGSFIGFIA
jgi:hypothetical protein